jgi:hypothetical protein
LSYVVDLDGDGVDDWIGNEACEDFGRYVWIRQTGDEWSSISLGDWH